MKFRGLSGLILAQALTLTVCANTSAQQTTTETERADEGRAQSIVDGLDWRGNLSLGSWSGNRTIDAQRDFVLAQWQLDLTANIDSAWSFKSNTNVSYMSRLNRQDGVQKQQTYVREAYLKWDGEQSEWRVGKQIYSWGRADRLNPSDQLSVRDFRSPFVSDDEQKLGSFGTSLHQEISPEARLQFVVQAVKNGQGQVPSALGESTLPLANLRRSVDYALKFDHSSSALDWSVSYFDGTEKIRSLELMQSDRRLLGAQRRYAALQSVGADAATTHGEWSFRGELAYLRFKDSEASNAGRLSHWYGVAGVENNVAILPNATFSVQYFFRRFQDDPRFVGLPDSWRQAINSLQIANNQFHRWQDGYTLRFAQRMMNDQLDYEIVAMTNARDQDFALRPRLNYRFSDTTKWVFGCDLFRGKDHSFFGSLRKNTLAFTELVLIY